MERGHSVGGCRVRAEVGEEEPAVVADNAAGAEGEGEPADPPADRCDREVREDLRDHGPGVLASREADLQEGEPGLHEHDQAAGDDHPHRVDPDRGIELAGDRLLEVRGVGERRAGDREQQGGGCDQEPSDRVLSSHPITLRAGRACRAASQLREYGWEGRREGSEFVIRVSKIRGRRLVPAGESTTREAAIAKPMRPAERRLGQRGQAGQPPGRRRALRPPCPSRAGSRHRRARPGGASRRSELVQELVGVQRVMVEHHQPLGPGPVREGERVGHPRVPPAHVLGVFVVGVLAIVDQQVGAAGQVEARDPVRVEVGEPGAQCRLVVGNVGDRRLAIGDPIAERRPAVGDRLGADPRSAQLHSLTGVSRKETEQGSSRTSTGDSGAEM